MKTETLYSRADWKYHKNKLGYDDVINSDGRLVVTISVMDIAIHDLFGGYASDDHPKEIFMLDADGCWSIFVDTPWLTPPKVQTALDKLGNLLNRTFRFESHRLPMNLEKRYEQDRRRYEKEIEKDHATPFHISKLSDWRTTETLKKEPEIKSAIPDKRLAAILVHKLKM